MELLVFGHAGTRVLVFPTRQGRYFDYEGFGILDGVAHQVLLGQIQLFCVDSVDSEGLYNPDVHPRQRIERHNQYQEYILREVLPLAASINPDPRLVSHGCSIGAYHAVDIAFRNPALFTRVVGLSGRYDLTCRVETYPDLFDGYYDEDIYLHTPNHYVPNIGDPALLEQMRHLEIHLAVGDADYFCPSNRALSQSLYEKEILHSLDLWHGTAHKPLFWRDMVRKYF